MKRSRPIVVRSPPQMQSIGKAVSYPGIDPRSWVMPAIIADAPEADTDGYVVDVLLLPDEVPLTVRLGSIYAGPGYGLYIAPIIGAQGLVFCPNGSREDAVWMPTMWCKGQAPPAEVQTDPPPEDLFLLHARGGTTVRIRTSGEGQFHVATGEGGVLIESTGDVAVTAKNATVTATEKAVVDAPAIELGAGATEAAVLGDALNTWLTSPTGLSVSTAFGPSGPAITGLVSGVQLSTVVKAK